MAMEEVNEAIQSVLVMLLSIEQLKSKEEECIKYFISGKVDVALNPQVVYSTSYF